MDHSNFRSGEIAIRDLTHRWDRRPAVSQHCCQSLVQTGMFWCLYLRCAAVSVALLIMALCLERDRRRKGEFDEVPMRLAEFIQTHIVEIVTDWEAFARTIGPGRAMTNLALRDHVEDILRATVQDMQSAQTADQR